MRGSARALCISSSVAKALSQKAKRPSIAQWQESFHFARLASTMAPKLHGRAFYESIGSPKMILAPMVDQSEFAWRMLSRSFMTTESNRDLLAYSPMLHARLFADNEKYREDHFQPTRSPAGQTAEEKSEESINSTEPYLDGNLQIDRPLFVQFCANDPEALLNAAKHVQNHCDAVDLNLGCPQGIARKGHYGAFLQEDWDLIYRLINKLHNELDIPITAKMRILETKEKTLEYAKTIISAGASIVTVHGRQREQKGHNTGVADWTVLKFLRENLPAETVLFANGNILQHDDIARCLEATGFDGVMSAEGNLYDPSIFGKPPPVGEEGREYWRGKDGKGGYRMDAVLRRYMDIIHRHVLDQGPPKREPLFVFGESTTTAQAEATQDEGHTNGNKRHEEVTEPDVGGRPPTKKQKKEHRKEHKKSQPPKKCSSPNLCPMQAHLFHLLRPLVSVRTNIRDALARTRAGDIDSFENILSMVETAVKEGIIEYEQNNTAESSTEALDVAKATDMDIDPDSSLAAIERCKRPWFICQPHIRPLPKEALEKGALKLSKKELARLEREKEETKEAGLEPGGKVEKIVTGGANDTQERTAVPKDGLVCG